MRIGKTILQEKIRWFHERFVSGKLPSKLGIYFHELHENQFDSIRQFIEYFRKEGYRFTGDPLEFVESEGELIVFLSLDDNFQSTFDLLELADELDVKFAVYLNTLYFRDRDDHQVRSQYRSNLRNDVDCELLGQSEVREIAKRGHSIGAHSHSHLQLSALPQAEAELEIRRCKEELELLVDGPVQHFSYPFGMRRHFNESLREYCRNIGFATVANAIPGMQHCQQQRYAIQRTGWMLDESLERNLANLCIDGRIYERLTGRSAVI
ncbi:Polysaccharide deacetylase [Rubripirellula amarantea]|uniref:Polysaccharide deacetylase n=1 Tax=Rubripirellula amarantea TaxID=2527999 RepID=A0A5C5WSK4_9BACT|nr:polysaccharide deacetylase family protein [Rubripirellula amarantea]TWT53139.1 Polysaccharide deacetylase [Rubripirellula amarantea]